MFDYYKSKFTVTSRNEGLQALIQNRLYSACRIASYFKYSTLNVLCFVDSLIWYWQSKVSFVHLVAGTAN